MDTTKIDPESSYQTLLVTWLGLLISQLLFLFLVFFIKPELFALDFTKPLLGESAPGILVLGGLAVLVLAVSFLLKNKYLAQSVEEQKVVHVQTAMIVGCALAEAISLFGLLLAFAHDYQYFFLFSALGILTTLLHFPKRGSVHAATYKI